MKRYRGYIFDLDGTLFRGEQAIPGAAETLAELRSRGAVVRFLTNNSTKTLGEFSEKLTLLGFEADDHEVYSSGSGTATYLADQGISRAYIIGEQGLVQMLAEAGVLAVEDQVQAVVVGLSKSFNYSQMGVAMDLIRGGAKFVATNGDPTYPMEEGSLIPGAGSIVAAVRTCSETEPFVVGKPNPYLTMLALEEAGLSPGEALVIGDRMDTDLESGRRAGCDTLLVLSGVTHAAPEGQAFASDVTAIV